MKFVWGYLPIYFIYQQSNIKSSVYVILSDWLANCTHSYKEAMDEEIFELQTINNGVVKCASIIAIVKMTNWLPIHPIDCQST